LRAALLLVACAAVAQEEPTPFWMPPPPPAPAKKAPPEKKKKPRPAPAGPQPAKPQAEKKKAPPSPQVAPAAQTPARKPPPEAPTWIEATPPAEVVRKPAAPVTPAPPPVPQPQPRAAPIAAPPAPPPLQPQPQPQPAVAPASAPAVITPPPAPPIASPPIAEPPAPAIAQAEEPEPAADVRNWSFDLVAGGWANTRSDGSGRAWNLAYGIRAGYGLFDDQLELEIELARAGGTSGSPFVSTTAIHDLAMLRAFWVWGDRVALLLGGGGGIVLAQTHYSLVDVTSGTPSSLDATAIKPVIGITAAGRVRVFSGLQARFEVSGVMRDGRLEFLPLLGWGWAL
jgi:hypothetical protein